MKPDLSRQTNLVILQLIMSRFVQFYTNFIIQTRYIYIYTTDNIESKFMFASSSNYCYVYFTY